mgnify:FL=1
MINDKAILVGVDGSHASYKATWWAANYAKHAGLTLQIVCAYSLPSYAAVSFDATYTAMGDDNAAHSDAQEILSKAKAIADEQGVEAATLIVTGDPASVFVELSRNYNLIVIGNRGKGGLAERLLGTTSSSLPAYAYCPIVVVPYTDDDGNLMHLNNTITKVAVGSDESKWGLKALEIAAAFADSWGAELDVISAVPNMKGSEDEGVMASFQEDLDVRIKPLEEAYPNLKINKQIACPKCGGTGAKDANSYSTCSTCNGAGYVNRVENTFFGRMQTQSVCPTCGGTGKVITNPCDECKGEGTIKGSEVVEIRIPAGVGDGMVLTVSGKGNAARHGGVNGDLQVVIEEERNPELLRDGNDLIHNLNITVPTALLGGSVEVPTVDGRARIKIAPGTPAGKVLRLAGKGLPDVNGYGRGDILVVVDVTVPAKLNAEEKRLVEQLAAQPSFQRAEASKGHNIFDRMKSFFR